MVLLATATLEQKRPLTVGHMQVVGQDKQDVDPPELRALNALTKVATATHRALAKGVARRFIARYGIGLQNHSHR